MLYHSWKYLTLIQDIFGIKNNQFVFRESDAGAKAGKEAETTYELDFAAGVDEILEKNAFQGFHVAGPSVDKALSEWTREYEKIGGGAQGASDQTGPTSSSDLSSNLTLAIDKLPQMTEQKKKIDMHVKIASNILGEIKSRGIDKLQDIEDEIITTRKVSGENKDDLNKILADETSSQQPGASSTLFFDKARLLVIMILCLKDSESLKKFIEVVESIHNKDPKEQEMLSKVYTMYQKRMNIEEQNQKSEQETNTSSTYGFARSLTKGLASGLSSMLTDSNNKQHVFAREVKQALTHLRSRYSQQSVKFLDCVTGTSETLVNAKQSLGQIFLFSIGGGSFYEYESLKILIEEIQEEDANEASAGKNEKAGAGSRQREPETTIIYGCDYVFQPQEFLQEIMKLN